MFLNINLLRKHTPRWVIYTLDIFICLFSLVLSYSLRFNFKVPEVEINALDHVLPIVLGVRALSLFVGKTYAGIVRYTSSKDAERIFLVITSGSVFFVALNMFWYYLIDGVFLVPFSIIILEFIITIFGLTAFRLLVKMLYMEYNHPKKDRVNVIIYGTDQSAIITKKTLDRSQDEPVRVVAFIEISKRNVGKKLEGVNIYNADQLEHLLTKYEVSKLIIAKSQIVPNRKAEIIESCLNHNVKVLTVPPPAKWINGELSINQIRDVRIEDLLGREPIHLSEENIRKKILNKTILVTGAAGSIGSEIVRQITNYKPKKLILFDQAESPLYEIEMELSEIHKFNEFEVIIGDVTNQNALEKVFAENNIEMVFHAAAYKHVPMMEKFPGEAVRTNVMGTKIIADLSVKYKVKRFVMISTDKAVNPTSVMGASKRIAEIYCQSLNSSEGTKFITTRFGNVLGSNGSVIPRFKKQIEEGGPLTITHPEITRYFMTIPEACQLVLEASTIGQGGEIFIFDMGQSVKILDLAKNMVKLSGLTLGKDIHITFTGLRPGEKLYEELLNDRENTIPTPHEKIMIAHVRKYERETVVNEIDLLIELVIKGDSFSIVSSMKKMVPEYLSKNSVFEELDIEQNG
ncbi:MAG: polysaccharide biosynthesis protein [Bacteroidetes bacterium GWF2_38_335]|nr:MAG: polysaccharide biosynthesis protein [Bacteroidetes bacterium GWF2_38_335]OFY79055.1 MAG: polysaccharide biosynthesis protein [Bacteroidetes bacterium RIFOXYA12_FULL_38_20]HBS86137.1 polysaccharide biosynthesis protein [Bacteroidales bacterium]